MVKKYKFSVILPTYNVEKYISRCLDSLQKQTLKDFEIVVIDDCSSDNSISIVKKYAKNDARIKIIHNLKNMGTYHARRIGVENAIGEYIVFLDPDDELEKDLLKLMYERFLISKAEILFYGVKYVPKLKWYNKKPQSYPKIENENLFVSYFSNGINLYGLGTPGKAYEIGFLTNVYKQLNIDEDFRFVYAEDIYLLINVILCKPRYNILKYDGYIYYSNPTSITMQNYIKMNDNIKQYDFMIQEIDKKIKIINLSEIESKIYKILKNKFLADRFLLIRKSGTKKQYFLRVVNSFLLAPSFSKVIRIVFFLITLSYIKL